MGSDSVVCVWHVITGDKVMQFNAHTMRVNGHVFDLEITAMTFDPTYRRLITAAADGTIKVNWPKSDFAIFVSISLIC